MHYSFNARPNSRNPRLKLKIAFRDNSSIRGGRIARVISMLACNAALWRVTFIVTRCSGILPPPRRRFQPFSARPAALAFMATRRRPRYIATRLYRIDISRARARARDPANRLSDKCNGDTFTSVRPVNSVPSRSASAEASGATACGLSLSSRLCPRFVHF